MRNQPEVLGDLMPYLTAVSNAVAAEHFDKVADVLRQCANTFAARPRTVAEIGSYVQWLRETQIAVRQCREHLALRLCSVNASQYGRSLREGTWSMDA